MGKQMSSGEDADTLAKKIKQLENELLDRNGELEDMEFEQARLEGSLDDMSLKIESLETDAQLATRKATEAAQICALLAKELCDRTGVTLRELQPDQVLPTGWRLMVKDWMNEHGI